tara:strand:- start:169 stop:489 length:321 start_codon:yes stop_codon:yes gene_type:complete
MTGATYTASWYLYEPGDDSVAKGRRASFEQVMRREQTRLASEGWEIEFAYQEAFDSEIGEFLLVLIWAISMTSCFVVHSAIRHRGYTAGHRLVHVHVGQRGAHAAA